MCPPPSAYRVLRLLLLLLVVLVSSSRNRHHSSNAFHPTTHRCVPQITTATPPRSPSPSVPPPPASARSPPPRVCGRPSSRSRTRTILLSTNREIRQATAATLSSGGRDEKKVIFRRRSHRNGPAFTDENDDGPGGNDADVGETADAVAVARHAVLTVLAAALSIPPDVLSTAPMVEPAAASADERLRRVETSRALAVGWGPRPRGGDDGDGDADGDRRGDDAYEREEDGFDIPEAEERLVRDAAARAVAGDENADGVGEGGSWSDRGGIQSRVRKLRHREGQRDPDPSTYGEVTEVGARRLFDLMGLTDRHFRADGREEVERTIDFVDLGSGTGGLVARAYLEIDPRRLRRVRGVELSPTRHGAAVRAVGGLLEMLERGDDDDDDHRCHGGTTATAATLELIEGDMFESDCLSGATHVYVASLCFTEGMMGALATRLIGEVTQLLCVATLKRFPAGYEDRLGGEPGVGYVQMSWSMQRGCPVYFYRPPRRR